MSSKSKRVKVRPVRKDKPDLRRLARVLIELALEDADAAAAVDVVSATSDPTERGAA